MYRQDEESGIPLAAARDLERMQIRERRRVLQRLRRERNSGRGCPYTTENYQIKHTN